MAGLFPIGAVAIEVGYDLSSLDSLGGAISGRLRNAGSGLKSLGRDLTIGLTAPIVGVGLAAVASAGQINAAMGNIATLIPGQTERVAELKREIQALGPALGTSTGNLAEGAYQIISAFGDTSDTVSILESNARAARAGLAETAEAIALTSAVTKGFGDTSAAAVQQANDLAFTTVRLGQTTFPELAASIGKTVPLMQALGGSQEELFAFFATLTGVTGSTAQVATQVASIQRAFVTQTDAMKAALQGLGYESSAAAIEQLGLKGALDAVLATTDGSIEQIGSLFGRAEALTAALALSGSQADTFASKLDEMRNASGATDEAFAAATGGVARLGFMFSQVKIGGQVLLEKLGDLIAQGLAPFVPIVINVVGGLTNLVEKIDDLPGPIKASIGAFVALLAAAGPILGLLGAIKGIAVILGPVLAGLGAPITAVIVGVTALAAIAQLVISNWDTLKERFEGPFSSAFETFKDVINSVAEKIMQLWAAVAPMVTGILGDLVKTARSVIGRFADVIKVHLKAIQIAWDLWGDDILRILSTAWDAIVYGVDYFVDVFGGIIRTVLAVLRGDWSSAFEHIKGVAQRVWNNIKITTLVAIDAILRGIQHFVGIVPGIGSAIAGARTHIQGLIRDLFDAETAGRAAAGSIAGVGAGAGSSGGAAAPTTDPTTPPTTPPGGGSPTVDASGAADAVRTISTVLDELEQDLTLIGAKVQLNLLDPTEEAAEKATLLSGALDEVLELGGAVDSDTVQALANRLHHANTEAEFLAATLPDIDLGRLADVDLSAPAFGIETIASALENQLVPSLQLSSVWLRELQDAFNAATSNEERQKLQAMIDTITRLQTSLRESAQAPEKGFIRLRDNIRTLMGETVSAVSEGFAGILAGTTSFGSGLKSVASGILGTLGDILVQEGQILIAAGLGIEALKIALGSLNGGVAIAAGIALVALGTAAKAAVSALAGGPDSAGSFNVSTSSPYYDQAANRPTDDPVTEGLGRVEEAVNEATEAIKAIQNPQLNPDPRQARRLQIEAEAYRAQTAPA